MSALLQAAIRYERTRCGSNEWTPDGGAPYCIATARDAFMAGAAAMAEIALSGQALRIEQAPKRYFVRWENHSKGEDPKLGFYRPDGPVNLSVSYILLAYDSAEANAISTDRFAREFGKEIWNPRIVEIRPAEGSDKETVIRHEPK